MEIRAQNGDWYDGIAFSMGQKKQDGSFGIVKNLVLEEYKIGEIIEPSFRLERKEAQLLMDDLWHCGIRPTEKVGTVGQLKATESHLKDMREIAFKKLNIK